MDNNEVKNAVQRMSEFTALLYYHLTKAMIEDYGEPAKMTIKKAIYNFGFERGQNIAKSIEDAGLELTIENLDKYYDMPITQGWDPQRVYDENHRKVNITESCTFAELWIKKNWSEIGHIYCEVDTAIREGYSEKIRYTPTKNILLGDEHCSSVTEYK